MNTIGFFGGSFCAEIKNDHSISHSYETYIEKLSNHYSAEILNLGVGGAGDWDCFLLQFQEIAKKQIPDICIFAWTESHRLFHRKYRNLNLISIENSDLKSENPELYKASLNYYRYLLDFEKSDFERSSLLYYLDNKIFPMYKNTKFIHMWSFKDSVIQRWNTGVEIRPALVELSAPNIDDLPPRDQRANHLDGEEKNGLLYRTLVDAIDNYQNNRLITIEGIKHD
jgi:hypothetical protein